MQTFLEWLSETTEITARIGSVIDKENLIFFFDKDGEYYGCPEESRLIYAKLKTPDEDVSPAWNDEANFFAYNLSHASEENIPKRIFYKKDLKDIKIMGRDEVEKELS